ncbi:hypothetical protein EDD21DRAFT_223034 [Dissophora ornata]|nr:hypothetical protein EDD21DRAFT_223034 [Dissophora ornata]
MIFGSFFLFSFPVADWAFTTRKERILCLNGISRKKNATRAHWPILGVQTDYYFSPFTIRKGVISLRRGNHSPTNRPRNI